MPQNRSPPINIARTSDKLKIELIKYAIEKPIPKETIAEIM